MLWNVDFNHEQLHVWRRRTARPRSTRSRAGELRALRRFRREQEPVSPVRVHACRARTIGSAEPFADVGMVRLSC